MYIFFPQPMYNPPELWYGLHMTTKTQNLKDLPNKLKDLDPKDVEKVTAHVGLAFSVFSVLRVATKSRRAAKSRDWNEAIYYAVLAAAGQAAIRYRLDDMRRKGLLDA